METRHYWEENGHTINFNSNDGFGRVGGEQLSFAAPSEDEAEYPPGAYLKKGKVSRQDPMSHRIIEKRRRDRMNNCLADLSRLIPPEYLKKGRGRVEKTEIIEMAIRHLKFLQERANANEREAGEVHFRNGYQEAVGEAIRYLAEAQGFPADGLCAQLANHLQRHCDIITKGDAIRDKGRSIGSSSETASSSSSSVSYAVKQGVIQPPTGPPAYPPAHYEPAPEPTFPMDCDRVAAEGPPQTGEARHKRDLPLRKARKPDLDYMHSYKFKNSIERRFSRSQDTEASRGDAAARAEQGLLAQAPPRAAPRAPSTSAASTSASASAEDARDTSPQDTSSESPHHHLYEQYEKPPQTPYVPVFALHALGKYYVPLNVEYSCLSRLLGATDALDARAPLAALHPVTIHVNFTPCLTYHVKREPERDWRPV